MTYYSTFTPELEKSSLNWKIGHPTKIRTLLMEEGRMAFGWAANNVFNSTDVDMSLNMFSYICTNHLYTRCLPWPHLYHILKYMPKCVYKNAKHRGA